MKLGKRILTYKDIEEAKKLIGKRVTYSMYLDPIKRLSGGKNGVLTGIMLGISEKFIFEIDNNPVTLYRFIREVIEEE